VNFSDVCVLSKSVGCTWGISFFASFAVSADLKFHADKIFRTDLTAFRVEPTCPVRAEWHRSFASDAS
jgi:hypothetical protein